MPVHRGAPKRCSPGPDCLCCSLGCPEHPCPALCGLAPAHLAKGTRAPCMPEWTGKGVMLWRVELGPGPRQMETHTKPSLRGSWQGADNALIQDPGYQRNQMPRGRELGSAGRSLGGDQWDMGISDAALPSPHRRSPRGSPSGPACVHTGTGEVRTGMAGQVPVASHWDPCRQRVTRFICSWV